MGERNKKIESRAVSVGDRTAMPAVGMRRTTRVFGVVTGSDSARVLRSGRRLWPDSGEGAKARRGGSKADEWPKKPEKAAAAAADAVAAKAKQETAASIGTKEKDVNAIEIAKQGTMQGGRNLSHGSVPDRFFGIVYTRKRKRTVADNDEKKMFGLRFSRRQHPRKDPCVLAAVVRRQHFGEEGGLFSWFLFLVLRHARRTGFEMKELSAFVLSEPLCGAYASRGIQFLQVKWLCLGLVCRTVW